VLEDDRLPMTADWGPVVSAIIDHFDLGEITLMGYSLGGCLAVRAAAKEPRIRRVICDDILTDFLQVTLGQVPSATRMILKTLLALRAKGAVNRLTSRAMRKSMVAAWGLHQGMHTTGTATSYDFLQGTKEYETASVSERCHPGRAPPGRVARSLRSAIAAGKAARFAYLGQIGDRPSAHAV